MDHSHHHDHSDGYAEKFFALGICAALGIICVLLWLSAYVWPPASNDPTMLNLLLAPRFHLWVLLGGIGLIALVVLRGLGWRSAKEQICSEHHHDDHEHGWAPWRYAVLVLPVMLYSLGLPNKGLTSGAVDPKIGEPALPVRIKNPDAVRHLDFLELKRANGEARDELEGRIGHMKGQFIPSSQEKVFSLGRYIRDCCGADARLVIGAAVVAPEPPSDLKSNEWIEVEGVIQFVKRADNQIVPLIRVQSMDKIIKSTPERNPYLQ